MGLIALSDGTSRHTGTTVVGPVAGTLTAGSNSFVKVNGVLMMVEDGKMNIPSHQYIILPPAFHSHSFSPDTITDTFVTVAVKKICQVSDSYSSDATNINGDGSNSFVTIT